MLIDLGFEAFNFLILFPNFISFPAFMYEHFEVSVYCELMRTVYSLS